MILLLAPRPYNENKIHTHRGAAKSQSRHIPRGVKRNMAVSHAHYNYEHTISTPFSFSFFLPSFLPSLLSLLLYHCLSLLNPAVTTPITKSTLAPSCVHNQDNFLSSLTNICFRDLVSCVIIFQRSQLVNTMQLVLYAIYRAVKIKYFRCIFVI
jgi:hypothetical protein